MPDTTTTAVIYAAKSTIDDRGSLDSQIAACREHAERNGWDVAGEYRDEKASGYSGSRGPDLIAAKEHAARLAVEGDVVLLAFASDRFARGDGTTKSAHLVEHVLDGLKASYRVECVTEDLGGEMALVLAGLYGMRANTDSKAKSAHIRSGLARERQRGRYMGPRIPFGYRSEGERAKRCIVPDPATALWYLRAVEWYEAGAGHREVAARLNEAGVPSPTGKTWERSQVAAMLRSPVYAGRLIHRVREGGKLVDVLEVEGEHDALIDDDRWEALQRRRESRRGPGRRPQGGHLMVGGVLRCPTCGDGMRARTTKGGHAFYECPNKGRRSDSGRGPGCGQPNIAARELDEALAGHLLTITFDPSEIAARVEAQVVSLRRTSTELFDRATKQVGDLDRRIERFQQEYAGAISADDYVTRLDDLRRQRELAVARGDELLEAAQAAERDAENLDAEQAVVRELEALRAALDVRDVQRVRELISGTFREVWLRPTDRPGRYVLGFAQMTDEARDRLIPDGPFVPIRYEVPADLMPTKDRAHL